MTFENVWVVTDGQRYFEGFRTSKTSGMQVSVFGPLSPRTRTYKSKRAANSAVRMAASNYESPYIQAAFIEHVECEDPREEASELSELDSVPEADRKGWTCLDRLCGKYPAIFRKGNRLAIARTSTDVFYLPGDELFAWQRYFQECTEFVCGRIRQRRISEGKDPEGMDEFKEGQ